MVKSYPYSDSVSVFDLVHKVETFFKGEPYVLEWGSLPMRTMDSKRNTAPHSEALKSWIQSGFHGEMDYMEKTLRDRLSPETWMPWGKSLLMFTYQYSLSSEDVPNFEQCELSSESKYRVAQYANYKDYHYTCKEILERLKNLFIKEVSPEVSFRGFVDSAPVFERDWASEMGLGWRGKNSCTIHPQHGSGFLLAGAVIDVSLEKKRDMQSFCGSCTKCLDACPTQAFEGPGRLNATKCISYWTIEQKGDVPESLSEQFGEWVFGCDVCQDVCPWNQKYHRQNPKKESTPRPLPIFEKTGVEWLKLLKQGGGFQSYFKGTPLMRAGRKKMLRNLAISIRNQKDFSCVSLLESILEVETEEWVCSEIRQTLSVLTGMQK